jgi:hypothetical protein
VRSATDPSRQANRNKRDGGTLKLTRQFGQERLRIAIETALETGCTDAAVHLAIGRRKVVRREWLREWLETGKTQ